MKPDASADPQARSASFLREMGAWVEARHVPGLQPDRFAAQVQEAAAAIEQRCAHFKTDEPSAAIVQQMALVVATFDALSGAGVRDADALAAMVDALATWVRQNAAAYSLARLGISADEPQQAFQRARENFKTRGEQRFGSHFLYVQEVSDEDRSFVGIHRCLYNELGRFLGRPQVTPVFCAMDMIWAEHAAQAPFNVRFERPTTLAAGGDRCRFQFTRVER